MIETNMSSWDEPLYVFDGDIVWLFVMRDKETGRPIYRKCIVEAAHGDWAFVVGHEINKLVPLKSLLVPPDSPRHRDYGYKTVNEVMEDGQ